MLLLRHVLQRELNDRAEGKPHRIAFFLVGSITSNVRVNTHFATGGQRHPGLPAGGCLAQQLRSERGSFLRRHGYGLVEQADVAGLL